MKYRLAGTGALPLILFVLSCSFTGETRAQGSPPETNRKPVIVELFTSEGCSTCPPADAFLAKLGDQQPVGDAEVIALEEHVDYWNQLGWSDPFSAAEWTQRQREYAAAFKLDGVYTPQMIVDGQSQFIGSRIREVMTGIGEEARRPKTDILLAAEKPAGNGTLQLTVRVGKLVRDSEKDPAEVWLAVTEKGLSSSVTRGENAGKDLHHAPVLRMLRRLGAADGRKEPSSFAGNSSVKFKPAWRLDNLLVVVFVQERNSRRILGAASTKIAN